MSINWESMTNSNKKMLTILPKNNAWPDLVWKDQDWWHDLPQGLIVGDCHVQPRQLLQLTHTQQSSVVLWIWKEKVRSGDSLPPKIHIINWIFYLFIFKKCFPHFRPDALKVTQNNKGTYMFNLVKLEFKIKCCHLK